MPRIVLVHLFHIIHDQTVLFKIHVRYKHRTNIFKGVFSTKDWLFLFLDTLVQSVNLIVYGQSKVQEKTQSLLPKMCSWFKKVTFR
ncbi:unnamed protein product [Schistosoma turkestanicum]|nr:unnamed protein product [Schistosoma turkestanicum]